MGGHETGERAGAKLGGGCAVPPQPGPKTVTGSEHVQTVGLSVSCAQNLYALRVLRVRGMRDCITMYLQISYHSMM